MADFHARVADISPTVELLENESTIEFLTPEEARQLARQLYLSADEVDEYLARK